MHGPGGLRPLLGGRDSWVLREGDDHGARKLLAKEQHAGWTAARSSYLGPSHRMTSCFFFGGGGFSQNKHLPAFFSYIKNETFVSPQAEMERICTMILEMTNIRVSTSWGPTTPPPPPSEGHSVMNTLQFSAQLFRSLYVIPKLCFQPVKQQL